MSDTDKNQALTIVIEKLTEIVGNISQDGVAESGGKSSGSVTPKVTDLDDKAKENLDLSSVPEQNCNPELTNKSVPRVKECDVPKDTAEMMEISMEQGGSPNQVVINLPVRVGSVSITNTEGLLKSLKQLDHGIEVAKERKEDVARGKELYRCSKCEYSSHNKHYLKQHVDLVHTAERPFKCPLCDYAGKRSHSLKEHLVVHSPFRPFMCPFCSASFRKKGHLTNHIKLHASEQAVACSICKHFIANRNELSRHLRQAHVGCQVFLCHVCEYATTSEANIVNHMHTHGNPTVYSCSGCRFIGVHEEILKKHVQVHHNGEGSFTVSTSARAARSGPVVLLKCSECGFTTNEREVMKSHMYDNHLICLSKKSGSISVGPDVKQGGDNVQFRLEKASDTSTTSGDDKAEDGSAKVISAHISSRPGSCDDDDEEEDDQVDHPTNTPSQGESSDNSDEEAQQPERGEMSKWQDAVLVKVGNTEGSCKSGQISYVCTSCRYSCKEAVQFIAHMLSHAPTNASKNKSVKRQANENNEDTLEQGFMRDKVDGLYCCLICGYACDHQRTIKAHIWKHSGHKDINYPTFQNGPLSMYEEVLSDGRQSMNNTNPSGTELSTKIQGASAPCVRTSASTEEPVKDENIPTALKSDGFKTWQVTSEVKSDYILSTVQDSGEAVVVSSDSDLTEPCDEHPKPISDASNRKRKVSEHKPSEMDVSMPKLRILSSGVPGLVVNNRSSSCDDTCPSRDLSADDHTTLTQSPPSPVVQCDKDEHSDIYMLGNKSTEDIKVVAEEVIESEDIVEVVIETSDDKLESRNEQALSVLALLKQQDIACSDDRPSPVGCCVSDSGLQIGEQGISSSLLAVIEQFRKDSSPGRDKIDVNRCSYQKVDDLYVCCHCQQMCTSLTDVQSHVGNHRPATTGQSVLSPVSGKKQSSGSVREGLGGSGCAIEGDEKQHECSETSAEWKRCFFCENCEESFYTVDQLLDHKMKITCWSKSRGSDSSFDEKDCFKCNFCDFVGMSVRSVKSHMKRHWNDLRAKHHASIRAEEDGTTNIKKYFACERCTSVFSNILDLLAHNSSSCSAVQMPRCTKCSFVTSNAEFLKKHMNYHHNQDKIYKCEMCDFVSKSYSKIDNHVKKHIEPCDLHCNLCDFVATSVRSLKSHMKRHTNDQRFVRQPLEQYKCNMCGYICHHLPALKSHMWRHASESNYSYEKTNAVINAAIEDGTQSDEHVENNADSVENDLESGPSQYSTVTMESDVANSLIAFRCCHCFYETCIKKELNEHMKRHMDIIQKTMEVNNELFCGTMTKDASKEDMAGI